MAPEQVARERHRGMEPERGAGDRRRCMEPEPVAGERRRGKVQVAAYASAQNTAKNRLGILWKNIRAEYVTIALVVVNVITYLVLEWLGDTTNGFFMAEHGAMYPDFIRINHEWWRIITAGFLHFGAVHLVNNMDDFYTVWDQDWSVVTGHLKYFLILSGFPDRGGTALLRDDASHRRLCSVGRSFGCYFRSDWRIPVDRDTAPGQI